MTKYGRVLALLNTERLLVRIENDLVPSVMVGHRLTVFGIISSEALRELGLNEIYSPKGEVKITAEQGDGVFLAQIFQEGGHIENRPLSAFASIFTQDVVVGGRASGKIEAEDALGLNFDVAFKSGDLVGRV